VLPTPPLIPLAQADAGRILLWSIVLVVLLVGAFMGVMYLRRWVMDDGSADEADENARLGYTLGDLRRMHQLGQLTDAEFETARTQMIAATQRAADRAAEAAKEAAKQRGGGVTDIEELRARARRNRDATEKPPEPPEAPAP
jgi:hypothetical protein